MMATHTNSTAVVQTTLDYLPHSIDPKAVEQALLIGDISQMSDEVRIAYYIATCRSVGLNPLTKPFQALKGDDGKISLYPDKGCAEQLRKLHRVSCKVISREFLDDLYIVTVRATTPDGREEESQGVVPIAKTVGSWEQTREGKRYFKTSVDAQGREMTAPLSVAERAAAIMRAECVPLDSEILTREGWKTHEQVIIGEEVLAYDVEKDVCQWTPLLNVTVHDSLPMGRLATKLGIFEAFCTLDHSWAVQWNQPYKPKKRVDGTYTSQGPKSWRRSLRGLLKASDIKTSHRLILAAPVQDTATSLLQPIEAAILGWVVTDGTIKRVGNNVRIGICQSKAHNFIPIRELVEAVAPGTRELVSPARQRTFPSSGRTYDTLPQHWWYLPASISRMILARAGFHSPDDLPSIVTRLDHAARQTMLQAMMLAEATQSNRTFANKNRAISDAFQILCALEGYATGKERSRLGLAEQVQRLGRHIAGSNLHLESIGMEPAWCPTTAYGTWVMRQRGRIMITGNTKAKRRVTLAICGLGMPDWDPEPGQVSHPMALTLQTPPAPADGPSLAQTIAELSDPVDPTAPAPRREEGESQGPAGEAGAEYLAQIEAVILGHGGQVEPWMRWAERRLQKDRRDFTVADYQLLLTEARTLAAQRQAGKPQEGPQEPAGATMPTQDVPEPSRLPGLATAGQGGTQTYTVDPETGALLGKDGKPLPNLMAEEDEPGLFGGDN
jgi:hypothetical protein